MSNIFEVIFFSLIGGVISLAGGVALLINKKRAKSLAMYATPFAAGALIAAAFVDLLTEAAHEGSADNALRAAMLGILAFFLLERFLHWFHHHHEHDSKSMDPSVALIVIGDTVHNFIDGIAIAAGFLFDTSTGIAVTLAVATHEIPQEIGDFGLLLHKGMSRRNVLLVNMFSALATTIAAVVFYLIGQEVSLPIDIVLGLVAGFFIYIAVSDIIPSIHKNEDKKLAGRQTLLLLLGIIVVSVVSTSLHSRIDVEKGHDHPESSEQSHDQTSEHSHE